MSIRIDLGGHAVDLLAERAAYLSDSQTLLIADVHLGKDQVFRQQGLAVPAGIVTSELARLDTLIEHTRAQRLMILGDWVHAPPRPGDQWPHEIQAWRHTHQQLAVELVQGNHDRDLTGWLAEWNMIAHPRALHLDGLHLIHEWCSDQAAGPGLSGHLHPGAVLRAGREQVRLPAFLRAGDHLVLPAFGRFTGLMDRPAFPTEQCWIIAENRVIRLPGKIRA